MLRICIVAFMLVLSGATAPHRQSLSTPTADFQGTLQTSLFAKIFTAITPALVDVLRNVTFPGVQSPHFSLAPFRPKDVDLRRLGVALAPPDEVAANVEGLTLSIPSTNFSINATIVGINLTCTGDVSVYIGPMNLSVTLHASTTPQQRLNFSAGNTTAAYSNITIEQRMDSIACQLSEDVIQVLIGNIDALLDKLFEQDLPLLVTPLAEVALNSIFAKIPLAIVGNPVVTTENITATVDLIASMRAKPRAPHQAHRANRPARRPRVTDTAARDVVLTAPAASVNALLSFIDATDHLQANVTVPPNVLNSSSLAQLFPGVAKVCVDCELVVDLNATEVPPAVAVGGDAVEVILTDVFVGISALDAHGSLDALFSIAANVSISVVDLTTKGPSQNVVWFQLSLNGFDMVLVESNIGPVDIASLSPIVAILLRAVLLPDFNKQFAGISFPAPLVDVALDIGEGIATVAFDVDVS